MLVQYLPHVLANVLVAQAARALSEEGERLPATGPSFRDITRVAGANTAIWRDIYLANADALIAAIDDATERLAAVRATLAAGDGAAVAAWNDGAREDRRRLLEADLAGGPVAELRVSVPNRPGVVAEVALARGRGGGHRLDLALYPAPDRSSGYIVLWIAGEERPANQVGMCSRRSSDDYSGRFAVPKHLINVICKVHVRVERFEAIAAFRIHFANGR
jgi:prephenate dehydrogenase